MTKEEKIFIEKKVDEYCEFWCKRYVEAYLKAKEQAVAEGSQKSRERVAELFWANIGSGLVYDKYDAYMKFHGVAAQCKELAAVTGIRFNEDLNRKWRNGIRASYREEHLIKTGQKKAKHVKSKNEYDYTACYYKKMYS